MFKRDDARLYYERSALQAADIYTKGFAVPAEWGKARRLINVLDPQRLWHGCANNAKDQMGAGRKRGVKFSYRDSNPRHGSSSLSIPDRCRNIRGGGGSKVYTTHDNMLAQAMVRGQVVLGVLGSRRRR